MQEKQEEEEEEARRREQLGEAWVEALQGADYDGLSLEHRVGMLCSLCHLAMDSPSIKCGCRRRAAACSSVPLCRPSGGCSAAGRLVCASSWRLPTGWRV